jgi:hypothetical protein
VRPARWWSRGNPERRSRRYESLDTPHQASPNSPSTDPTDSNTALISLTMLTLSGHPPTPGLLAESAGWDCGVLPRRLCGGSGGRTGAAD